MMKRLPLMGVGSNAVADNFRRVCFVDGNAQKRDGRERYLSDFPYSTKHVCANRSKIHLLQRLSQC